MKFPILNQVLLLMLRKCANWRLLAPDSPNARSLSCGSTTRVVLPNSHAKLEEEGAEDDDDSHSVGTIRGWDEDVDNLDNSDGPLMAA